MKKYCDRLNKTFHESFDEFKENKYKFRGNSITCKQSFYAYFSGLALGMKLGNMITEVEYKAFDGMLWELLRLGYGE